MPDLLIHHAIGEKEIQRLLDARRASKNVIYTDPPERADTASLRNILRRLQSQLPYVRVAVLAKVYETDTVLVRFPLVLIARLRLGRKNTVENAVLPIRDFTLTIGSLATDHVGYASFDLRPLRSFDILVALAGHYPSNFEAEQLVLEVDYQLLPFGENQRAIDLLADADVGFDTIVMRLQVNQEWLLDRRPDPSLPAMQNPSIDDWRLSPGSFALAPARLVGDADCEDLYPSDLSSHTFRFHHLLRTGKTIPLGEDQSASGVGFGWVTRYRSDWYPLGHSLGRVLYSLPLAPGEKVNLAIIDWQRQDDAFRDETTGVTERLEHDTQRDRVVGEIVRASIRERQRGHSVMGGLGSSVLAPVGGAIIGGSLGLGGSKRSSSGSRDIVANTIQDISDGFQQSSTAFRELRSTVVTQTSQVEGGRFETRRIANFNHCHTLTILYYEVLRHYRTSTVYTGQQPVLFVDFHRFARPYFDEERALVNRLALEAALLDGRHASGFDALSRKRAAEQRLEKERQRLEDSEQPAPGSWNLTRLVAIFHTGSKGHTAPVRVQLVRKDGTVVACRQLQPPPTGDGLILKTADHHDFDENSIDTFVLTPDSPVRWQDLQSFHVRIEQTLDPFDNTPKWRIDQIEVYAKSASNQTALLVDHRNAVNLTAPDSVGIVVNSPTAEQVPTAVALTDYVSEADLEAARQLLQHLEAFGLYYTMVILFSGDPVARQSMLENLKIEDRPLSDLVENRVIDFDGRSLVFPMTAELNADLKRRFDIKGDEELDSGIVAEDLVSVPTKGVFADGKQGHCNTCETIDDTRFWDFQKSPIPGDAPSIGPVSTDTRFQAPGGLTPTTLPANIVNVQSPAALPDPDGLASALKVLGTANIFRDMSGGKDLADFLTKVVEGSQKMVSAFAQQKAKEDLLKTVDGLSNVSDEDKGDMAKEVVKTGSSSAGSGQAIEDDKSDSKTGVAGSDANSTTPTQPDRRQKPERPSGTGIDGFTVRLITKTDLPGLVSAWTNVVVHPEGQSPTEPVKIVGDQKEIRLPKSTSRKGAIQVFLKFAPLVQIRKGPAVSAESMLPDTDEQVSEIEDFLRFRNPHMSESGNYDLREGESVVEVVLEANTEGLSIHAPDIATAYEKLKAELNESFWVYSVGGIAVDPEDPTKDRGWAFTFGKFGGGLTLTVK